jgi:hypothetical protein
MCRGYGRAARIGRLVTPLRTVAITLEPAVKRVRTRRIAGYRPRQLFSNGLRRHT